MVGWLESVRVRKEGYVLDDGGKYTYQAGNSICVKLCISALQFAAHRPLYSQTQGNQVITDRHYALIIIPLYITQAPTCFDTYVPSSGSVFILVSY
jgi:hypothetical protein